MTTVLFASILGFFLFLPSVHAQTLATKLSGRILIQTQQNGEAWYVDPHTQMRYFLSRPEQAFQIMRQRGIGIGDIELYDILVADANLGNGLDTDGDGLSDALEVSMHTTSTVADSDGDGYSDKTEVINGFSPWAQGRLSLDTTFARSHVGKIFLQVQTKGEAWYVNPVDLKRYYLGRPADAFTIMRSLGLGITDNDLNQIPVGELSPASQVPPPVSDKTAPLVDFVDPVSDASAVAPSKSIAATFNKPMDPTTFSTSTFIVGTPSNPTQNVIAGTRNYGGSTVTFIPTGYFAPNTTYTITITTGVKDTFGNSLASPYSWSFRTGAY